MKGMNKLAESIYRTAEEHGWWEPYEVELKGGTFDLALHRPFGEIIALIHSEASEGLEEYRKGRGYTDFVYQCECDPTRSTETSTFKAGLSHATPYHKPLGIPSEMADIIIRVLDFCGKYNVDIDRAMHEKMLYNNSRPYRHGGKVC